ncbi:MAG: flagellar biosynthetic protein FliR [Fimbriimonadaceae bacterium]|nr:flagellar biosynthetic protein FliR [Fimbriimonadaceae bacterium]
MTLDAALLFTFLLVFCRCSAMLLTSPVLGGAMVPVKVRIMLCMAIAGSLSLMLKGVIHPVPHDIGTLTIAVFREIAFGLLLGGLVQLVFQGMMMAGALIDLQMGLGISQAMNPITGVPVSVIAQFKYFLCLVLFMLVNGHHTLIRAFVQSYAVAPATGDPMPFVYEGVVTLLTQVSVLAIQIALPVLAVTLVVDAAFGVMNKAVPAMQVMILGVPAKALLGLTAITVGLPMLVVYTQASTGYLFKAIERAFGGGG